MQSTLPAPTIVPDTFDGFANATLPPIEAESQTFGPSVKSIGKLMLFLGAVGWFRPEVTLISGNSMNPNISNGSHAVLIANTEIERFDIVTFPCPTQPEFRYIKRVIGLPGEEISLRGDKLYVNGNFIEQPQHVSDGWVWCNVRVPEDSVFVLGDNRPHSSDSREFGCVKIGTLKEMVCKF